MKKYTDEMISFLRTNTPGKSYKEITKLFNDTFNLKKTPTQLSSLLKRHGIKNGISKTFIKGHIPYNKGKKFDAGGRSVETRFKKGNIPTNYRPIGSERIDKQGYTFIKIADPNIWKAKHIIIYENEYGPIPKGHVVIFADGDKTNIKLDNLILISKRELLVMNRDKLIKDSKELTKTGHLIAKLKIKVDQKKKG